MAPGAASTQAQPEATCPAGGQCFADVPSSNPFYAFINRIYPQDLVTGYPCGGTGEPCDPQSRPYYRPNNNVTRQQMAKFIDNARRLPQINIQSTTDPNPVYVGSSAPNSTGILGYGTDFGVKGQTGDPDGTAVYAEQDTNDPNAHGWAIRASAATANGIGASTQSGTALQGQSTSGYGIYGSSDSNAGIRGVSNTSVAVLGGSNSGVGVEGSSGSNYGVWGQSTGSDGVRGVSTNGNGIYGTSSNGFAGQFLGQVYVTGNMTVTGNCCQSSAGSYRIDDPTDPANKYLYQSAVESSDMLGIYRGHVTLDTNGEAYVDMPSWFQSLYGDFDYQLTCVGGYAPVFVAQEMENNRFEIAGGKPGLKVSWQVTGVRHDPYAQQHPVPTQQDKPAGEQGTYLHPELYGQSGK